MDRRSGLGLLLLGWVLVHAGREGTWKPVADFGTGGMACERVRASTVTNDVLREIGSALADQPADNPIRREAYGRAERRIRQRYRCEWRPG